MALTGTHRYVDTSATYNGDGTSPEQATSDGGTGAYNSIQSALSAAPNNPSSESDRWLIWVRRLDSGSNISITSTLSPANDGSYNAPHMLIGWPYREQKTGMSVDSVPTGTDSLGFNNAQWQFIDSALTEGDNYWVDAVVEFTSGSNSGLSRRVIWFDAANDKIYLNFPLPNDIAAGDGYTITLETHYYDDRPSAAQSLWDGDTSIRPVIDGGDNSITLLDFTTDYFWILVNFKLQNANGYAVKRAASMYNILTDNTKQTFIYDSSRYALIELERIYAWNKRDSYYGFIDFRDYPSLAVLKECHINKGGGEGYRGLSQIVGVIELRDCTFGRVTALSYDIDFAYTNLGMIHGENVMLCGSTPIHTSSTTTNYDCEVKISGYNGEKDKFHSWRNQRGEIYNVDEDATIDPPSGASTYIKLKPVSNTSLSHPLEYEEQRYQSSGSKTYTWKFYPTGWSSLSTSDIGVEAWYLDESTGTHRAYATANPSSVTNDTWNDLSITVNPAQAGTVYFKIKLKKYESTSAYIALDPKVDVS